MITPENMALGENSVLGTLLICFSLVVIKTLTKSNLGKEDVIRFACPNHSLSLKKVKAEIQGKRSEKKPAYWFANIPFLIQPRIMARGRHFPQWAVLFHIHH